MTLTDSAAERMTMVTDYLLALVAAVVALRILPEAARPEDAARIAWSATFSLTAAAAVLGGTFHGFRGRLGAGRAKRVWMGTLLLSAAGSAALLVAAGLQTEPAPLRWGAVALAGVKLAVAWGALRRSDRFGVVLWDAGLSVLLVLGLAIWRWGVQGEAGAAWTAAGAIVALLGGAIQMKQRRLPLHLDHNDLFHLAQAIACYLLYLGATGA